MQVIGTGSVDAWGAALAVYFLLAVGTIAPVFRKIALGVPLHAGGAAFKDSPHFSDAAKKQLEQHFSRIVGTLGFWKKQAEIYRYLHYYCLLWTILLSVIVPFLAQAISNDSWSK
jgi:hypothetical protein